VLKSWRDEQGQLHREVEYDQTAFVHKSRFSATSDHSQNQGEVAFVIQILLSKRGRPPSVCKDLTDTLGAAATWQGAGRGVY